MTDILDNPECYVNGAEAARRLGCTQANLGQYLKRKNPPPHKLLSGRPVYPLKELLEWWNSKPKRRKGGRNE